MTEPDSRENIKIDPSAKSRLLDLVEVVRRADQLNRDQPGPLLCGTGHPAFMLDDQTTGTNCSSPEASTASPADKYSNRICAVDPCLVSKPETVQVSAEQVLVRVAPLGWVIVTRTFVAVGTADRFTFTVILVVAGGATPPTRSAKYD